MNYSTVLVALVASQVDRVEAEVNELLQPHLRNIAQLVASFFGERTLARRGLGL